MSKITKFLEEYKTKLEGYAYYLGDECGVEKRDWDKAKLRICLVFCGPYDTGAGNLAVPMLHNMIEDAHPDIYVDRAYFPASRLDLLKFEKNTIPIFGVESKMSLKDFDIVGFSLSYSVALPLVLKMLHMSGIPLEAESRTDKDPLIIAGGHSYHVFESLAPAIDAIGGGDGEISVPAFIDLALAPTTDLRGARGKFLMELSYLEKGWYIPRFYKFQYKDDGDIEKIYPITEGTEEKPLPFPIRTPFLEDLDKGYQYVHPILPFADNGMGLSNVLVSRSCENSCRFCGERYSCGPYREMSFEGAYKALSEIYKWSGSSDVTPSAFSFGSYSCKRKLLTSLIENISDKINLISQRVNDYSDNPDWAALASFVGDKTVSFGVEGNSQRMRDRFNKNITTPQILDATRFCMRHGYQKIKYFMIANAPLETEQDRVEVISLAQSLADLRRELGATTAMQFSWTQFVTTPHTPMQWIGVTQDQLEGRHMAEIIKHLKEMGIKFRFGSGAVIDEAYFQQTILFGDRRLYPILKRMALLDDFVFYGNVPGGFKVKMEQYLHEAGLSYEMFLKDKSYDYIFPYDVWNVRVSKKWLWKEKEKYEAATTTPRCKVECTACGSCTPSMKELNKERWAFDDGKSDTDQIERIQQRGTVQKLRVKFATDADHAGVHRSYWMWQLRRAANIVGLPLSKSFLERASDEVKAPVRVYGVDYADFKLFEMYHEDTEKLRQALNEHLRSMEIQTIDKIAADTPMFRSLREVNVYAMKIPYEPNAIAERIKQFYALPEISQEKLDEVALYSISAKNKYIKDNPQIVRVLMPDFKKGFIREMMDTRSNTYAIWQDGDEVFMALTGQIVPAYLLPWMFKIDLKEAELFPTRRVDFITGLGKPPDFFSPVCPKCGSALPKMLNGKVYTLPNGCLKCINGD